MFYHGANDWWNLPKTRAQEPNPTNEGPLAEIPARVMHLFSARHRATVTPLRGSMCG